MEPTSNATARTYLDFQGLGELRGQAARDGKSALRETARQFEAMFLQMMMKSMRDSIEKSELTASPHADTFEAMFDKEVSMAMAKRGAIGLADMLVDVQSRQMGSMPTAAQALAAREAGTAPKGLPLHPPQPGLSLQPKPAALAPLQIPGAPLPLTRLPGLLPRSLP
jgi:Rod binding domain-containing protein